MPVRARGRARGPGRRSAGNAAVGALMAAKLRSPGEQAVTEIDAALKEIRGDEPAIDTVEMWLKEAKAAGVPVSLEGPEPPASALAVTTTGFGPESVAAKKPVPPTKPVPAVNPLGKAGAVAAKAGGPGKGAAGARRRRQHPSEAALPRPRWVPLRCPPTSSSSRPRRSARADDPAFTQVKGNIKGFARDKKAHPPAVINRIRELVSMRHPADSRVWRERREPRRLSDLGPS